MRPAVLGVVLVLLFAGLVGPLVAPARAALADWTFLVYMGGDNDLEPVGITDFLEMAGVGSTPNVNVVVQFDRSAFFDTSHGDWSSTKRFLVLPGMAPDPPSALMDLGGGTWRPPRASSTSSRGPRPRTPRTTTSSTCGTTASGGRASCRTGARTCGPGSSGARSRRSRRSSAGRRTSWGTTRAA